MSTSKHRWSSRLARTTLLAFAGLGVIAAVAVAATINGGGGDDILVGTPSADVINGKGGNDIIYGNLGDDYIDGAAGNDGQSFSFNACAALCYYYAGLEGGSGSDRISGGSGNDLIHGDGVDCLENLEEGGPEYCYNTEVSNNAAGNDNIDGGIGNDDIYGNQKDDTLIGGAGSDDLDGGSGNDRIYARDGQVDYIYCGSGSDLVQYDKTLDVFHNNDGDPKPFANSDCEAPLTT